MWGPQMWLGGKAEFSFFLLFEVACLVWCVTIQVLGMGAKNRI